MMLLTLVMREAMFYDRLPDDFIRCGICFRRCVVAPGKVGFCRVRENINGKYFLLVYSLPSAVHIDPIEKEPQYHFLPGSDILCIGTVGCNFVCRHCHNWHLSQAKFGDLEMYNLPPEEVIKIAKERKIPTISFTYNEPLVFFEYVYDIARLAKKEGIRIIWHSNGSINPEPLKELLKYTDGVTIDLKGFSKKAYDNSSAELEPVLQTLKIIKESGKWLEIVNLIVTTINDDTGEIRRMCRWIRKNLGVDVPLHFTRFFPNYKLTNVPPTPISTLEKAYEIAKEEGIKFVYIGNVPGHKYNSTYCPKCGKRLIYRVHFSVLENNIVNGRCKFCGCEIPGVWR